VKVPGIPAGTVWPWCAVIPPPEGWDFLPTSMLYASAYPLGIVALVDHDKPPALPQDVLARISPRQSKQGRYIRAEWKPS
jgi:hypothetical protein